MAYYLMNKDTSWLLFSCERDEYDEVQLKELKWLTELRPLGYADLFSFLDRRKAPKHRKHIEQLLERYGCTDIDGFIRVTHAVSLNDTFWVKEEDSSLNWADVSLYAHFNTQFFSVYMRGRDSQSVFCHNIFSRQDNP